MIGRISSRSCTWSTGVESSWIAFLLLADDPPALLDEADADGDRDAVRGRLIGVQHAVQRLRIVLVADEQRPREHVPEQQDDAEHLVRLDPAGMIRSERSRA